MAAPALSRDNGHVRRDRHRFGGVGPLRRDAGDRVFGGVAAGLAARTGLKVTAIRAIFIATTFMSGFGLVVYMVVWLCLPAAGEDGSIVSRATRDARGIALAVALASMLVLMLIVVSLLGVTWLSSLSVALVVTAVGLVLIWRNASPEERAMLHGLADPTTEPATGHRRLTRLRVSAAAVLMVAGAASLPSGHVSAAALQPLGAVLLLVAGIVVLLGPWWLRLARDLVKERQARVRAEERADIAAVVHDSVLQTLALIQRRADNPQQVIALARAQERELRSWLFDGRAPGEMNGLVATFADGVRRIQQEVEANHGVTVEAVTVGDCQLDDDLGALLAAAREATVNAAKWSGAPVVSLFAEVESGEVAVFVRDRGCGFDPEAVPEDRRGLAESVRARMARRGGCAEIRSVLGEGTEVSLMMPRPAASTAGGSGGSPPQASTAGGSGGSPPQASTGQREPSAT
jgi:signal transduction histidine kinase